METEEAARIADELHRIRTELAIIRWILFVGLALAVLVIFDPGDVLAYVLGCAFAAAILGALGYGALFLLEKIVKFKSSTGHAEARMRAIVEEYEARENEGAESTPQPETEST